MKNFTRSKHLSKKDNSPSLILDDVRSALGNKLGPVLLLPPDITRYHSGAGNLTCRAYNELTEAGIPVMLMPALGTHAVMTPSDLNRMFTGIPHDKFLVHNWRNDIAELGRIEKEWVEKITGGAVSYDWPAQVNKILTSGSFSLIVSVGQVVPHEVAGMANHSKNLFVGIGGKEGIDKSHFAGAAFGMERITGKIDTPVRAMFDEGLRRFSNMMPPVFYLLTVLDPRDDSAFGSKIFKGFGRECFEKAAALSQELNISLLDKPVKKMVVYLDPKDYKSSWLGNKAIYRTRMAMADGGELLILAPGLETFGEDPGIDRLVRRHGYRPADIIREKIKSDPELGGSLSAAAHLIHGSPDGRFTVRYCPGPGLSRREIEDVGYEWGDLNNELSRYDINKIKIGANINKDGEEFFYIPNPGMGLWSTRDRF